MAASFLDFVQPRGTGGPAARGASGGPVDEGTRPGPGGRAWDFAFATGIECSNPVIADPQGRRLRRDLPEECGHYRYWREAPGPVEDRGTPCLRHGPPQPLSHPRPG